MRRNQRRTAELNSTIRKLEDRNSLLVDERNELVWAILYPWIELFSVANDYFFFSLLVHCIKKHMECISYRLIICHVIYSISGITFYQYLDSVCCYLFPYIQDAWCNSHIQLYSKVRSSNADSQDQNCWWSQLSLDELSFLNIKALLWKALCSNCICLSPAEASARIRKTVQAAAGQEQAAEQKERRPDPNHTETRR